MRRILPIIFVVAGFTATQTLAQETDSNRADDIRATYAQQTPTARRYVLEDLELLNGMWSELKKFDTWRITHRSTCRGVLRLLNRDQRIRHIRDCYADELREHLRLVLQQQRALQGMQHKSAALTAHIEQLHELEEAIDAWLEGASSNLLKTESVVVDSRMRLHTQFIVPTIETRALLHAEAEQQWILLLLRRIQQSRNELAEQEIERAQQLETWEECLTRIFDRYLNLVGYNNYWEIETEMRQLQSDAIFCVAASPTSEEPDTQESGSGSGVGEFENGE